MEIIYLMFCHYICDFWLQTEKEAKNKSTKLDYLFQHVLIYSISMGTLALVILPTAKAALFVLSCFIFHGLTDFITSKLTRKQYLNQKFYGVTGFFSIIGLDQFLHFVQIYLTYQALIAWL